MAKVRVAFSVPADIHFYTCSVAGHGDRTRIQIPGYHSHEGGQIVPINEPTPFSRFYLPARLPGDHMQYGWLSQF